MTGKNNFLMLLTYRYNFARYDVLLLKIKLGFTHYKIYIYLICSVEN